MMTEAENGTGIFSEASDPPGTGGAPPRRDPGPTTDTRTRGTAPRKLGTRDGLFKRHGWWWIDYYDADGRRHREKAAPSYEVAKLVYRDKMNAIAKGEVLGVREEGILFRVFVEKRYWPAVEPTLAQHWRERSKAIVGGLVEAFGDRPLSKLRQEEIERWNAERLGAVKPTTANKDLARLKHLLTRAVAWGYLKASPAAKIRKAKEPTGRVRFLTAEERRALLEGVDATVKAKDGRAWTVRQEPSPELRAYILAALHAGARRTELLRLTWRDLDTRRRTITFRETKNRHERTVPMSEPLHAMLAARPRPLDPNAYVLPRYEPLALTRAFARLAKRVGVHGVTFHDLRHDVASTLTMAGVSQRAVMEFLGHRDPRMTVRYQHLAPGHLQDAVRALERATAAGSAPALDAAELAR